MRPRDLVFAKYPDGSPMMRGWVVAALILGGMFAVPVGLKVWLKWLDYLFGTLGGC